MYVAKSHGKNCYRVFESGMKASMMERLELLADLQRALDRDEFALRYQPVILLESGRLSGVEALVRWQHPQRGLLSPAEFIPLAEESGAIMGLGKWVLSQACRQAVDWRARYPGGDDWTMSVNVSVKQLQSAAFVAEVAQVLRESGIDPRLLILEVTESVMMHDAAAMLARLRELKDLGVRLAIDDFGTGYSAMSYLRQLPFDLLKIDKTFIDNIASVDHQKELTKAIIELGKTLGLELVAEGIEDGEQLSRLQSMRCELGQGFYFAEPMDSTSVEELLRSLPARSDAA
jgi:EAL domain-containing protein (putative c-di-GMP-specific phosphodiesterase class I)